MVWYGWRVLIADQRGHGKSDGVSLHVDDFRQYVHDLQAVYDHFDCNPCSTAILGHSMGGLVSVRFAQALQERVAALVLLSPLLAVKVRIPWYLRVLSFLFGRLIAAVAPRWRFDSRLSRADTARSPLIEPRQPSGRQSVTLRWFVAMQAARKRAWREATRVRLPLLVLQAEHDRIVDPLAPGRWLAHVSSPDKTLRHIPHACHELLREPDWGQTLAYVADWLGRRVARAHGPAVAVATSMTSFIPVAAR
jgi:lysophospholipase